MKQSEMKPKEVFTFQGQRVYTKEEVGIIIYKSIIEFTGTEEPHTEEQAKNVDKKINKWIEGILK